MAVNKFHHNCIIMQIQAFALMYVDHLFVIEESANYR